jgi:hypothetical protein
MIRLTKQIGLLVAVVFALAAATPAAVAGDAGGGPPAAIGLAGGWQFLLDQANHGLRAGWQRGNVGTGWRDVTVPRVFDARPLPSLFGGSTGWYRLHFRTPSTPAGFSWAVRFEQSRRSTQVWLNGHYIGAHQDPYTPFQLALGALTPGAENTLVVRVDNHKFIEPREGWWNWGGLTRPVSLVPLGPVTVANLGVMPDLSCPEPDVCSGRLIVDAVVTNRGPQTVTPMLRLTLDPPAGAPGNSQTNVLAPGTLRPGQTANLRFSVPLDGPLSTWAPEHPNLYSARLDTLVGTAVTQRDQLAIGMRKADVRGGLLYLNGRQVDLRGASIEEDAPGRGPALTEGDEQRVVDDLRAVHANVTRAQYPLSEELLDRLDRAGILVWTEAPIYNRDDLLHTAAQRRVALSTLGGAVLATRNHPSILTESVANELTPTPDEVPGTKTYIDAAVHVVRELAPAVPVSIDVLSYPNFPAQQTYHQFDMLGISNYYGWYAGKVGHSTARLADLAPFLRLTHARYPAAALVTSEFGAEATYAGPAALKGTFAFQTQYIQQVLATVASLPFLSGAIYWTLREFAVKPHWNGGPPRPKIPYTSIHHKGLINYAGQPKPAFGVTARLFAQTPLYPTGMPTTLARSGGGPPRGGTGAVGAWVALLGLAALGGAFGVGQRRRRRGHAARARVLTAARSQTDSD